MNENMDHNEILSVDTEDSLSSGESEQGAVSQDQVDRITREVIENMIKNQAEEETEASEEETEEENEEATELGLIFEDPVDAHLYLSSKVENANMNDIYSVLLSSRNIILLFVLIVVVWKLFNICKTAIYKMFNM